MGRGLNHLKVPNRAHPPAGGWPPRGSRTARPGRGATRTPPAAPRWCPRPLLPHPPPNPRRVLWFVNGGEGPADGADARGVEAAAHGLAGGPRRRRGEEGQRVQQLHQPCDGPKGRSVGGMNARGNVVRAGVC